MKRLFVAIVSSLTLCALILGGCGSPQAGLSEAGSSQYGLSQSSGSAESARSGYSEASEGFSDVDLTLLASAEDAPDKLTVRFYEETPNVPYIGLAQYMALVFGDKAKVKTADGVATITSTDGGVAIVDDVADTLTSENWSRFHNYLEPMQQGKRQGFIDNATPFCRISSLDYEEQTKPLTFDFSKYGINLHVDDGDAYLPLATASDLMADVGLNNLAYNGHELCLLNGSRATPQSLDPAWYEPVAADEPRAQDMADYSYGELCFVMDTLYSCSGKGVLDVDIAAKGLDTALTEKDELTQRVRELIKSTDKAEHFAGMAILGQYVANGHTYLTDATLTSSLDDDLSERVTEIKTELSEAFAGKDYSKVYEETMTLLQDEEAPKQRSEIWADGASYHEQGDTAVISLDSFSGCDREGWDAFYAGTGARPDGSNTPDFVGTLLTGLEKAKSNPDIRYVVIDLSTNGGGSNDLCATALAILTGRVQTPVRDLVTGQRFNIVYDVDTLFDGSFNATAAASGHSFDFAVLTSRYSFSCANYFPSLMRDAGVPVIGEVSAGGTDMVVRLVTPDGQCLWISDGFAEMTDAEGNQLEKGVPPDVELVTVDADGKRDYSACYDISRLSEVMHGLYSEETLPAAA